MIRKQTTFLVGIFCALLGLTLYLQRNNQLNMLPAETTPSPTAQPAMLVGWLSTDITWMELKDNQAGSSVRMAQDPQGAWLLEGEDKPVDLGKVEQIRSQVVDTRVIATMSGDYALDALNLSQPAYVLTVGDAQGKQSEIRIGKTTPTSSGYYVQVNGQAPVVASQYAIQAVLDGMKVEQLLDQVELLLDYTPTPAATATSELPAEGTPAP